MDPAPGRHVELDRCRACHALYFDVGELCRHLQAGRRMEEGLRRAAEGAPAGAPCARCLAKTATVQTPSGLVEVCRGCGGVLLAASVASVAASRGLLPVPGVVVAQAAQSQSGERAIDAAFEVGEVAVEVAAEVGVDGALVVAEAGAEAGAALAEVLFEGLLELLSFS